MERTSGTQKQVHYSLVNNLKDISHHAQLAPLLTRVTNGVFGLQRTLNAAGVACTTFLEQLTDKSVFHKKLEGPYSVLINILSDMIKKKKTRFEIG